MKYTIKDISLIALCTSLVFIASNINILLPFSSSGGLVHLGTTMSVIILLCTKPKVGISASILGMALFDILGGWFMWVLPTILARFLFSYTFTKITNLKNNKSYLYNTIALILGGLIVLIIYYLFEAILYQNWYGALSSIYGNIFQFILALLIGFPISYIINKQKLLTNLN